MGEHDASIRICAPTMVEYLDGRLGKLMTEYIYLDESNIHAGLRLTWQYFTLFSEILNKERRLYWNILFKKNGIHIGSNVCRIDAGGGRYVKHSSETLGDIL